MESSINLDLTACRCISATRWPQTVSSETGEKERISFKPAAVWTVSAQMVDACSVPASAELISRFFSLNATAVQCAEWRLFPVVGPHASAHRIHDATPHTHACDFDPPPSLSSC